MILSDRGKVDLRRTIIARLVLFSCCMIVVLFLSCKGESPVEGPTDTNDPDPNISDTYPYPDGKIFFTSPPLGLDGVLIFEPMGLLDVIPESHAGAHHNEIDVTPTTIPIYAMADGQIVNAGKQVFQNHNGLFVDYWMTVQYSTTISTKLGHVGRFTEDILTQLGDLGENRANEEVRVPVFAGDTLGYVYERSAFDIGITDESLELDYIYPEFHGWEDRYSARLTDYFHPPLLDAILEKCIRTDEPRWGKVDYDVPGKLVGAWFLQGTNDDSDSTHFAIAYHHIYGTRIGLSDGFARYALGESSTFMVKGNNPKPETIGQEDGFIKYEVLNVGQWQRLNDTFVQLDLSGVDTLAAVGTYLLQILGPETLKVERFFGQTADDVSGFTDNFRLYARKP